MTSDTNTGEIIPPYIQDKIGDRRPVTEEEQKDFEEYHRQVEEQQGIITSYEDLIKKHEIDDKLKDIKKWVNKLGEKCVQMHSQSYKDPGAVDRLRKGPQFYRDIVENMRNNPDIFLNGDIDRQHRLLQLLASPEYDTKEPLGIIEELEKDFRNIALY